MEINLNYFTFHVNSFLRTMSDAGFRDIDELSRHMLLFVSALVPKALSSLLTSCSLELAKPHNVSTLIKQIDYCINPLVQKTLDA